MWRRPAALQALSIVCKQYMNVIKLRQPCRLPLSCTEASQTPSLAVHLQVQLSLAAHPEPACRKAMRRRTSWPGCSQITLATACPLQGVLLLLDHCCCSVLRLQHALRLQSISRT